MNIGDRFISRHTVSVTETADRIGSGGLPVFSTPSMIALMEKAAFTLAGNHGTDTVGIRMDVSHLRACLPGTELAAEAEVTGIDGRKITFHVRVTDRDGVIGEGVHERFIIDPERFMSKLKGK